jgi:hypothetical protein
MKRQLQGRNNKTIFMHQSNPLTFCISTYNNLPYLKLAIHSVRKNSYFKDAPFIIHAENCTDETNGQPEENNRQTSKRQKDVEQKTYKNG